MVRGKKKGEIKEKKGVRSQDVILSNTYIVQRAIGYSRYAAKGRCPRRRRRLNGHDRDGSSLVSAGR